MSQSKIQVFLGGGMIVMDYFYYVLGVSKREIEQNLIKPGEVLQNLFENGTGRPTPLTGIIKTPPELKHNSIWGCDYYCKVEVVDGLEDFCRLTFTS